MQVEYRLTPIALWHIRRPSPEIKSELARKLGRSGYALGTHIQDDWKADYVPKETALALLREATGLPDNKIIEEIEIESRRKRRY
ncbi:hypothetical protein [Puia dinghuensis]|uniref:Uncharacterized protein n=1 Tax=Puia dinghuensis TaxID=1792502 RepID=A0A8J2UAJ6_9BACT|nr:hypothetical protein [Puia dinghuensis]GGA90083.1 hypothetical protein GCM10011511_11650 [Puia dinghuensis]